MTPELEAKIRAEFEQAMEDWLAHDDWQFADREAAWKFFFLAGRASVLEQMEPMAYIQKHPFGNYLDIIWNGKYFAAEGDKLYRLPPELQAEKEKK